MERRWRELDALLCNEAGVALLVKGEVELGKSDGFLEICSHIREAFFLSMTLSFLCRNGNGNGNVVVMW